MACYACVMTNTETTARFQSVAYLEAHPELLPVALWDGSTVVSIEPIGDGIAVLRFADEHPWKCSLDARLRLAL